MNNVTITLNSDDLLDISSQTPLRTHEANNVTNVADVLQGERGEKGDAGKDGVDGQSATVSVGTVTTLPAGSNATVVNSGTPLDAILDFGIPEGEAGEDSTIAIGTVTTLPPDTTATVVNSGTASNAVLDFGIPQGIAGQNGTNGNDGIDGMSATVTVGTVTTLPAGSNATVTNTGTITDAVLDFGIPQGVAGQNGQDGTDGRDGTDGTDGQSATVSVGTVSTLPAGSNATVTNTGTSLNAVLDFGIPQGVAGQNGTNGTNGQDGADGQSATVSVGTVTTLPAGSSATVVNSGTSLNATLDFGIPKGDTGTGVLSYTTSEQDTGVKWMGYKLYRKTVNTGAIPNATVKDVTHGVTGIRNIVKIEGIAWESGGTSITLPYTNPYGAMYDVSVYVDKTYIHLLTQYASGYTTSYVTIYYTK